MERSCNKVFGKSFFGWKILFGGRENLVHGGGNKITVGKGGKIDVCVYNQAE